MPAPTVTLTQVSSAVSEMYDRNLLSNARAYLCHDKWGQIRVLKRGSGTQIKFRRPAVLSVAKVPLTEGIPPTGSSFSYAEVTATPKQYGDFVTLSDKVDLQNTDPVLANISTEQGVQAGETIDELRRDVLVAGTSVLYANGSARTDVNTIVATDDFRKVIRLLGNNNAKMIGNMIVAGKGIGTVPIRPAYMAIIHPDTQYDVEAMTGFKSVEEYASQGPVLENEIGAYKNVRFVVTTKGKSWAGGGAADTGDTTKETGGKSDVYATLVFAMDAYGLIPMSGMSLEFIVQQLGSAGAADPLMQQMSAGWKAMTTTKILNDNFMVRIEHAVTL